MVSTKKNVLEDICFEYYGSLYKGQQTSAEAMSEVLDGLPVSFTDAMNEKLAKPFTILEFLKEVEGMANGKAPGHDGIPIYFFKECWHIVREGFFEMIIHALDKGEFHQSITKGLVSLIPNERDLKDLNYWRPITLQTIMYKIFAKVMRLILQTPLMEVISSKQTTFLPL